MYCGIPAVSISALIDYVRCWNNHGDASGSLVIYRVGWEKMFVFLFFEGLSGRTLLHNPGKLEQPFME